MHLRPVTNRLKGLNYLLPSMQLHSENNAMNEWLSTNQEGYTERLMKGDIHYCVEFYDERFHGDEADSIVEIWISIEKK